MHAAGFASTGARVRPQSASGRIPARFFPMDVAMLESGQWAVVEVNDGGVSGLPASIEPRALFAASLDVDR
jgi:ATP-grasp domain-containing protein